MNYKIIIKVIILFSFVNFNFADYISLDGNEWQTISFNKSIKLKARVPGSIYSDLRREKFLDENLYFGNNDVNYRWVSYDNWTYERTFDVDSSVLTKKSVNLVAEGIDTLSSVYINDKLIGKTENMFVRYKFDVKNILKSGQNSIRIAFQSAPIYTKQAAEDYKNKYNYPIIPDCSPVEAHGECHAQFIRKMAASFSWDWGPAFPTQGIWKPIGIEAYDSAIIRDITVETTPNQKNTSQWTLNINTYIESADKEFEGIFNIDLDEINLISNQKQIVKSESDGTVIVKFVIPITNISITPWFPNGVANNTQKLYQLKVKLSFSESKEVSTQTKRIGFRKIELIQNPVNPIGLTFYFQINSIPFYAKGSNWIPANVLYEDITRDYLRHFFESAKEANMNMMRVWGGGIYESDYFYQLADEFGIMIWQDMMFACALYPSDEDFLNSVKTEIVTQVRRIQYHPSIAVWAGNNENEVGLAIWWGSLKQYYVDYYELYIQDVMNTLLLQDNTRPFLGSSPSNGLESAQENYTAKNPDDFRYGDVHFYDDGAHLWDWNTYPSAKFASEYGFQSYPSLQTLSEALTDSDLVYPVSAGIEHRQHHPGGTDAINKQVDYYLRLPSKGGKERLNDLIYSSQIIQAMAMKTQTEFYRRNREIDPNTGNGYTMGALYWQLNDIWQAPSWASIEVGGKWKILHSYAIKFLNNILVSPFEDKDQTLKVSLVRDDYLGELEFDLLIKVYKWSQLKAVYEINSKVKTNSFSSDIVYTHSIPDLLNQSKCLDRSECVLSFEIKNSEYKLEANNFMLLNEPKNAKIIKPNIKLTNVKKGSTLVNDRHVFDITLSSESVAPFVALDFQLNSGISGQFLENGFFIFDKQKTIRFETKANVTEQQISEKLTFKTLTDVL